MSGEHAWVQHMVALIAQGTGRLAAVLPQGALFRKDAEGRIRRALLEQGLVETVVGLAPNIFTGTGLAHAVVILRRAKPAERKHRVLVIHASSLFRKRRAQNFLDPGHARLSGAESNSSLKGFTRVVTITQRLAKPYDADNACKVQRCGGPLAAPTFIAPGGYTAPGAV